MAAYAAMATLSMMTAHPSILNITHADVGRVVGAHGQVRVVRPVGQPHPCKRLDRLFPGDVVRAFGDGTATLLHYSSGSRTQISRGGAIRVTALGFEPVSTSGFRPLKPLSPALLKPMQPTLGPAALMADRSLMARTSFVGGPRPISPTGGVMPGAVVLRWCGTGRKDVTAYRIRIWNEVPVGSRVTHERREFRVKPPANRLPLPPGVVLPGRWYRWQVTEQSPAGSRPGQEARLRKLTPIEVASLSGLEKQVLRLRRQEPADPSADLVLGEYYERLGLSKQAQSHFSAARMSG